MMTIDIAEQARRATRRLTTTASGHVGRQADTPAEHLAAAAEHEAVAEHYEHTLPSDRPLAKRERAAAKLHRAAAVAETIAKAAMKPKTLDNEPLVVRDKPKNRKTP
jgi:hypothetical protein